MEFEKMVQYVNGRLEFEAEGSRTVIEPWGADSLRVRTTPIGSSQRSDWALDIKQTECKTVGEVSENRAYIRNGKIEARVENTWQWWDPNSLRISFYKVSKEGSTLLLSEKDYVVPANHMPARFFRPTRDDLYYAEVHFEAQNECLFGMGQNETGRVDLKGCTIDLYQRHIKATIPFVLSSKGYGFLWNNPSLGRVEFSYDRTRWVSYGCRQTDYYIPTGNDYKEIYSHYIDATGHAPMLPYWASGFWQCKARYETQQEALEVAREFKKRNVPISVLVIDFLHWDATGNWRLDKTLWPDPKAMNTELAQMGIKTAISPWILVGPKSDNYQYMLDNGMFTGARDGCEERIGFLYGEMCGQYDPTNPEAAEYLWSKWKEGYVDNGFSSFWLDPCDECHFTGDYDKVDYSIGSALECHSVFACAHQKNIYDGMVSCGKTDVVNICRNAWIGSQRYGACPAPHDIESSFRHLKAYFKAGLNMSVSGPAWWNCDIGGFVTNNFNHTEEFYELMVRWYQWGVFMPIFRTHGARPNNEPWTVGGNTEPYICAQIRLREALRPYVMKLMKEVAEGGAPCARPLYFDYPDDTVAHTIEDELLFGDILVAPVLDYKVRQREVYLLEGEWIHTCDMKVINGGRWVSCPAPMEFVPTFIKADSGDAAELMNIFSSFHTSINFEGSMK